MNVVRHPQIGINCQAKPPRRFDQCIAKELIIRIRRKNSLPIVAALDNMLRLIGDDEAGEAGHSFC